MCGITGYIKTDSNAIHDTSCIISMLNIQKHRGPDDSGIRAFSLMSGKSAELNMGEIRETGGVFEGILGFNRLSILDLSANGHQPMVSPDGSVLLTLNGEIYNAFDFKSELSEWGYRFRSTTDTEVVMALYLRYGFEGMLSRLNGMFALVIADLAKKEVFVTRDRFGIKPMYYISRENIFAFSSELKSFMFIEGFSFRLAEDQLDEYLLFRNNMKGTLFQDILSLQPGHYISFKHDTGVVVKRYFNIDDYTRQDTSADLDFYREKLESWLGKSVERQLMSDVKLGCQLSGGIDSSLVTWFANRNSNNGNFETVSIVFNDRRFNEEQYVNCVTDNLGIISHKFLLDPNYYFENFEKATWHLEAPISHPNTVAIYKLSQRAKEYVTVLLSGEGADEVFGGYGRFYDLSFPYGLRKILHEAKKNRKHPDELRKYFNQEYRAVMATAFIIPALARKLMVDFSEEKAACGRKSLYNTFSGSLFDRQVKYEMLTYLPDLLIRQDKMSMAHSIENRVPFLDNEVVENSFSIPEKLLLLRKSPEGFNTEKYLLKKITSGIFGNDFAFRDKMGFGIPVREYFLNPGFTEYLMEKILPGIKRRGIFNYKLIAGWLSDIKKLRYDELEAFWVVISFEIWASVYLDNKK
ncbi:MAG: asparagine synthase (glutamine-hydrolyzing) [Bacteroidales bacterium]